MNAPKPDTSPYADVDSQAGLTIRGVNFAHAAPVMFSATLGKLSFHLMSGTTINLHCAPRGPTGITEWGASINRDGKPVMYIGILQRTPNGDVEFHT